MTVIRIKIGRQTGPYGRVPQNRFWFVPNCEQGIVVYYSKYSTCESLKVSFYSWQFETE